MLELIVRQCRRRFFLVGARAGNAGYHPMAKEKARFTETWELSNLLDGWYLQPLDIRSKANIQ
jgi:hypothetical protein